MHVLYILLVMPVLCLCML